jgi:2-polyprenyl-3-methyl-5-hydroxy-6-metoxy-1,4-benzoquinol methylase
MTMSNSHAAAAGIADGPGFPPLVCPDHREPLVRGADRLRCPRGHEFAIFRGIPRIIVSDGFYTDAFGIQWNQYKLTQLDSYTGTTISRDRLRRCLGETVWSALDSPTPIDILEAGCGAGRFTENLLAKQAAVVTSIDLSLAVEANQDTCPQSERHRILQCDITRLPFAPGSYDVVVCLGVIQHTPEPEATIRQLYAQVKPGGWLVIDHYRPSIAHYTKVGAFLIRPLLKRLSPAKGMAVTEHLTKFFFPAHKAVNRWPVLQMALSRISPLLTYYRTYPQLDDRLQYEWALLDTHDSLTDFHKKLRTPAQVRSTLSGLSADNIWVAIGGNGVEARCRKPEVVRA